MQAQIDIQKMLYDALSAGLSVPVYDDVPQDNDDFPYVVIGDSTFTEDSTDLELGFDVTSTIHVWSRYPGFKEIKELQAEIYTLLNRQPLDTDNADYGIGFITFEFSNTLLDADGLTRQGVSRFRIYMAEPA